MSIDMLTMLKGLMLKRGDHVVYTPWKGCPPDQLQAGIVKRMCEDGAHAFVLYHTAAMTYSEDDLDNYTAARTAVSDLRLAWAHEYPKVDR